MGGIMKKDSYLKANFYLLLFICIIASGVILKLAAKIIVPVMFAILLSLVMLPVLQKLKKSLHIPWIVSAIAILGTSLLTDTSYAVRFSVSVSVNFLIYSRLWILPMTCTCSPTSNAEANLAFLPQQIHGI